MIELQHIQKVFNKGQANETTALKEVSLSIHANDFIVIVGSNGSGKSTLLNTIAGAVIPSSGEVFVDATNITNLPEHQRSRWVSRVFQNPSMGTAPDLSILENFRLAALRTNSKHLKIGITTDFIKQVQDKVAQLGMHLEDKLDTAIGSLSGGQRQALTLLMCTMDSTKIILLDEPTAALDPRSASVVLETANNLIHQNKVAALMVTHNLKDAFQYGNRLIFINDGRIEKDLNAEEKKQLKLNDLFEWFA